MIPGAGLATQQNFEATLVDCSQFHVTVETNQGRLTYALAFVEISFSDSANRLELVVRPA